MNAKAIVFDLDGTLIDSEPLIKDAIIYALQKSGHPVPAMQKLEETTGMTAENMYKHLLDDPDLSQLLAHHGERIRHTLSTIKIFSDVDFVLQSLKSRGIALAICTSRKYYVEIILANSGLDRYFDVVVTRLDTENPKPHPEPILMALERLRVKPSESFMIGDSPADVEAGRAAGMYKTIAIDRGRGTQFTVLPDVIVHSLHELLPLVE